jgi:hypothetical protein
MLKTLAAISLVLLMAASPAAATLLYQRPSTGAIVAARDDGTGRHVIAHGLAPIVSPDGRMVAYFRRVRLRDELRLVSTNGSGDRRLLDDPVMMTGTPVRWAPESRRLVAEDYRADAWLFDLKAGTKHHYRSVGDAAFSPTGHRLVLEETTGGSNDEPDLFLKRIGTAGQDLLGPGYRPVWSAAGIAYRRDPDRLVFAHRPRARPHAVAETRGNPIATSADGHRILVSEGNDFTPHRALLVDPLAKSSTRLTWVFDSVNGLSRNGRLVLGVIDGDVVQVNRHDEIKVLVRNAAQPSWNK